MPVYTGSKRAGAALLDADGDVAAQATQYPVNANASAWGRLEPLLTPEQLKTRFLVGIPMVLKIRDPETKEFFKITDDMLKDYIELAVADAEEETSSVIMPTQFREKLPFHKQDFEQFGYAKLPRRPIASIEDFSVSLADGSDIFVFPPQWIETANLIRGQLNLIPLAFQGMYGGTGIVGAGGTQGSSAFFNSLWARPWVAALFGVSYTAGWKDGLVPKVINNLIGTIAAMRVLSIIAAAYAGSTSTSLGMDGMSQSVSTPGPQRYAVRIEELKADRALYTKKIKKNLGLKVFSGTV